jgi:hypothetical protein
MMDKTPMQAKTQHVHGMSGPARKKMASEPPGRKTAPGDGAPPLDRLINGRYRLLAHRGSGRLGVIYEAVDEHNSIAGAERHVAVQLLDGNLIASRRFTGEFESGVNSLQGLAHPNLVGLLDAGRDDGRFYIVTELQDSASLRFVLDDVGRLPLEETTAVVRAVGDALRYLHAKSFVHGNVKPENVLVTFDYEVRLLDVVPPEWPAAIEGDPDPRDDVYGLACLAYEMLSSRHPFNANTPEEALRAGLEPAPVALLSEDQWRALAAGLELRRERRTPTVVQFLDELGITGDEKLRAIVAGSAASAPEPAPATAAEPAPAERPAPAGDPATAASRAPSADPVSVRHPAAAPQASWSAGDIRLPPRAVRIERPRSSIAGKLLALFLLGVFGAIVYVYQDLLREEGAAVLASINARITGDAARTPAPPARPPADVSEAPVTAAVPVEAPPGPIEAPPAPAEIPPAAIETPSPAAAPVAAAEPGPPRFSFGQPVLTVAESDVAVRIVIRRSGNTAERASIAWWTDEGSAIADQDFADLGRRVERFGAGETMRTVFIPLTNDTVEEPVKSFNVYLGRADGRGATDPLSGMRVDIVDDD